nr:indolepyruvate ferredoxin oxidoreductase subunit alpha [Candidatus Dadabacteria bacterium]NIS07794.1 indolepyruvate ferredoxin oxidoreductase subunit alpha [Candidatus Dadabacteria bacterium]NIY21416.1 indolepyruvate ferredoxin oxidoreductase [Candidatus Dadabacteria bacterium]
MGSVYSKDLISQLTMGEGQTLYGDTPLVILKSFLQSGVSYVGGYPGAPTASLIDVISDAYYPVLKDYGMYFDCSGNEASAASLLSASINYPVRGSVNWKIVGTNVASDALAHICSSGVTGGAMIIVGEDYGCDGTIVAEKAMPFALKSSMAVIDPRGDLGRISFLIEKGFELSEYSNLPVMFILSTRIAYIRNKMLCKDNLSPRISTLSHIDKLITDVEKIPLPPYSQLQEKLKYEKRLPVAREFIVNNDLNELFRGENDSIGIITHGSLYNSLIRCLYNLGEAELSGKSSVSILNLNVTYPLASEQITEFIADKKSVLVLEEGMPNLIEEQIRAVAQRNKVDSDIYGKDIMPVNGEYTPDRIIKGLGDFLVSNIESPYKKQIIGQKSTETDKHVSKAASFLDEPVTARNPIFCTGCPERPIFTAIKILEEKYGRSYYASDIGCYSMSGLPPFNLSDSITGMGIGLASAGAISRMTDKRTISFMGDGTFWHSGLTTSIANALYNNQNAILIILENFWTSMTGHHENPTSGENMRKEGVSMSIEQTLRGAGVKWIEQVDPYDLSDSMKVLARAYEHDKGLRVILSRGECQLEKNRRERVIVKKNINEGKRTVQTKLGVDAEVCTGDHSCMRHNGCPSLTLKESPSIL